MFEMEDPDGRFQESDLWWNEWDEQEWRRNLLIFKNYPQWAWRSNYWNESAEVIYWEPLYHPTNAFIEIERTLKRMRILFHWAHDEFAVRCFEIESKIG